jgi:hypothetical protein
MNLRKTLAVIATLALGACSATGEVNIVKPKAEAIRPASDVALKVSSEPGAADPQHATEAVEIVRLDLSDKLAAEGLFANVVGENRDADYTMTIDLKKVVKLPFGARYFGGAYGAVNRVHGDVSLIDNANGIELTQYTAEVQGAPMAWAAESRFPGTVKAFDDKVVEGLQSSD